MQFLTYRIAMGARKDKDFVGSASVEYLMYSGYVSLAYHWLKMEVAAEAALVAGGVEDKEFYAAKIETSHFYFENILPRTRGLVPVMLVRAVGVVSGLGSRFCEVYAVGVGGGLVSGSRPTGTS
jgi:hypothetical protein